MTSRKRLAIGAAGVLALAGAGAALAATGSGGHPTAAVRPGAAISDIVATSGTRGDRLIGLGRGFGFRVGVGPFGAGLDAAASYLGISQDQLRSDLESGKTLAQIANSTPGKSADGLIQALVAAGKQKLDAAVKAGDLTQTQETDILSHLQQAITDIVNGTRPAGPSPGQGFGFQIGIGPLGAGLDAVTSYLGITTDQLRSDLESGKTLAQIANSTPGKSADGLIQALVAAGKQKLDAAVKAGKLTQAQETTILSGLKQMVTDLVNGTRPSLPGSSFGFGFGHAFGPPGGDWHGAVEPTGPNGQTA
jgi:hypothetical protein